MRAMCRGCRRHANKIYSCAECVLSIMYAVRMFVCTTATRACDWKSIDLLAHQLMHACTLLASNHMESTYTQSPHVPCLQIDMFTVVVVVVVTIVVNNVAVRRNQSASYSRDEHDFQQNLKKNPPSDQPRAVHIIRVSGVNGKYSWERISDFAKCPCSRMRHANFRDIRSVEFSMCSSMRNPIARLARKATSNCLRRCLQHHIRQAGHRAKLCTGPSRHN